MRVSDVTSPVDSKPDNRQDGTQYSLANSMPDMPKCITAQDNQNDGAWNSSFSPHKSFIKNYKGNTVQSIEPIDRQQRESFLQKSTNWKDIVDATSPLVSSFLSKNKESNPSTDIDVLGAAVQKLTSEAEILSSMSKNTDSEKSKWKSQRAGDIANIAKQTAKSKMLAEINRRRRAKFEEEKKGLKQSKDDLIRNTKSSCALCGVGMADGPRNICKSCMTRQKRDKSREKTQGRDLSMAIKSPPSSSPKKDGNGSGEADPSIQKMYETTSPVKIEEPHEEIPVTNRSLSLDVGDSITDSSKKYTTPKRTHTDLGPNSILNKPTQDKGINDIKQVSRNHNSPRKLGSASNLTEAYPKNDINEGAGLKCIPLEASDKSNSEVQGIGKRMIKRSTTDSEIVSKTKLINKPITSKEEQKSALVNSAVGQQIAEDSKKRDSPKSEKRESLGYHSMQSQENLTVGMKLERSKTVMGKMNVDGDKKSPFDLERTRKKEGSNVSAESEKSYSNKKFTNPGRSHTTIGDGHNKRQKNKGDWMKPKTGKRENSSNAMTKDPKKKNDKKNYMGEEDGKRVSFVEGEPIKKVDDETALITSIQNTFPKTLYDYKKEDGDESSDDEEDSEPVLSPPKVEMPISSENVPTRMDKPERIPSSFAQTKPVERENRKTDEQARYLGSNDQVENPDLTARYGGVSSGYDSFRSSEPEYNSHVQRWSDENTGYETALESEDENVECEEGDNQDTQSESSYSETFHRALDKIEEQSDEEVSEESSGGIYTCYPSKQDDSEHHVVDPVSQQEFEIYFLSNTTHTESTLEQKEESYTMQNTPEERDNLPNSRDETYYDLVKKPCTPSAEYTEISFLENSPQSLLGNGDSAKNYFNAYETDVDTGLSVLHPQNEERNENKEPRKEWIFLSNVNDDSSSSSEEEDDQIKCSDSWYTGGYYDEPKSETSVNNDDLIYFNDKAAKKLSDSDIYTGELFSNAKAKGNDQTDMSKNNNITLEDNLFEGSNFWIISSRPQMHQMKRNSLSRTETNEDVHGTCPNWGKDLCGFGMAAENWSLPFINMSNNNGSDDECSPSTSSGFKGKFPLQIASQSDYTEYSPDLLTSIKGSKPTKEIVLLGNRDFRKYDMPVREHNNEILSSPQSCLFKTDTLFFGDEPPKIHKPKKMKSPAEHSSLYFNTSRKPAVRVSRSPEPIRCSYPKDDDYQGGFFYATRYESNGNNNNNDQEGESYTGCFRNEEEYKPTYDGLFNDKASSFVYQKRSPEPVPLYFCSTTSKSYYDNEESVYAFEKKIEPKPKPIEVPKILKVGSIIVRNNVECEVDYAQNIDMDSQDVPKTWMRYDYGGDSNVADTSSYAQNVSFEEFGGVKPWAVEGCRAPWKLTKLAEKTKGKDESNKNGNGSWKAAPDKMVKSVKNLGSYVTKWF